MLFRDGVQQVADIGQGDIEGLDFVEINVKDGSVDHAVFSMRSVT